MELMQLGKSDIKVTPMAFGAWAIGGWNWGGAEEDAAIKAVRSSYELGITSIDTAPIYGFGQSENLVAKAMEGVSRDKYQILTKFGLIWDSEGGDFYFESEDNSGSTKKVYKWASKEKVMEECEQSLRRLKTDYIDLYQIHWPDKTTPVSETFEAVERLIEQGKVRAAGVCNYNTNLVAETLETIEIASNQVPYSMINRGIEKDVIPQAIENNIGIIAYSPLQRGILTGKIKPGHTFNEGDGRKQSKYYTDENIRRTNDLLNEIKVIADDHNATLAQLVIKWTVHQPRISCVLVGARDKSQVKDNVQAMDLKLSKDELQTITAAADKFSLS